MGLTPNLKHKICSLFDVIEDDGDVQRVITPLEYPLTGDRIVIRVRHKKNAITVDENGDAAMYAAMSGGEVDFDAIGRWLEELKESGVVSLSDQEVLSATADSDSLVAPYIFRVAEAAQQLFSISTSRATRQSSDFKARVAEVVFDTAKNFNFDFQADVELPIAGGLVADFVIDASRPLIVIAATSLTRLLEAEIIHMQYQISKRPGFVLAVAESQASVGKKQFERANYYTDKTVSFNPHDFRQLLTAQLN